MKVSPFCVGVGNWFSLKIDQSEGQTPLFGSLQPFINPLINRLARAPSYLGQFPVITTDPWAPACLGLW